MPAAILTGSTITDSTGRDAQSSSTSVGDPSAGNEASLAPSDPSAVQARLDLGQVHSDLSPARPSRGRRRSLVARNRRRVRDSQLGGTKSDDVALSELQQSSSTSAIDSVMLAPESSPENSPRTTRGIPDLGSSTPARSSHASESRRTAEDVVSDGGRYLEALRRTDSRERGQRAKEAILDAPARTVRQRRTLVRLHPSRKLPIERLASTALDSGFAHESRSLASKTATLASAAIPASQLVERTDEIFRLRRETNPALLLSVLVLIFAVVWMGA